MSILKSRWHAHCLFELWFEVKKPEAKYLNQCPLCSWKMYCFALPIDAKVLVLKSVQYLRNF